MATQATEDSSSQLFTSSRKKSQNESEGSFGLPILYPKVYFIRGQEVIKVHSKTQSLNLLCVLKYTVGFIIQFYV